MKYILLLLFTLSFNLLKSQDRLILKDQTLTHAILDQVISQDINLKTVQILIFNSKESLKFLTSYKPEVLYHSFNHILGSSDQKKIDLLLDKSYLIDTSVQHSKGININYILQSDKNIMSYGEYAKSEIIYNFHLVLSNDKQKCLVYYQVFKEGGKVAILEKINNSWKLIKKEVVYYE